MTYIVFSDLDGTLLDHDTYSFEEAREGLELLHDLGAPLVLVSSKTFPEMKEIHREMGLSAPFIFENGGGIFWPDGAVKELLGAPSDELKKKKHALESALGEPVRFITEMDAATIAGHTGLSEQRARLSQQRAASIPFIIPSGRKMGIDDMTRINHLLHDSELQVTKGGRFYHFLSRKSDKGAAIVSVIGYYRRKGEDAVTTVGIGDSENDIPMFRSVDIPVVVRKKDGSAVRTGISGILETSAAGPAGFTEAVNRILKQGHTAPS